MNMRIYILSVVLLVAPQVVVAMDGMADQVGGATAEKQQEEHRDNGPKTLARYLENMRAENGDTLLHTLVKREKSLKDELERLDNNSDTPLNDNEKKDCLARVGAKNAGEYCKIVRESIVKSVNGLIQLGFDVNLQNKNGKTPLYCAAKYRTMGLIYMLLNAGADANKADKYGVTPLGLVCNMCNNAAIVQSLLPKSSVKTIAKVLFSCDSTKDFDDYEDDEVVDLHWVIKGSVTNSAPIFVYFSELAGSDRAQMLLDAVNNVRSNAQNVLKLEEENENAEKTKKVKKLKKEQKEKEEDRIVERVAVKFTEALAAAIENDSDSSFEG